MVLALLPRARIDSEDEREGHLTAPDPVLTGDELLAAVTEAMCLLPLPEVPNRTSIDLPPRCGEAEWASTCDEILKISHRDLPGNVCSVACASIFPIVCGTWTVGLPTGETMRLL